MCIALTGAVNKLFPAVPNPAIGVTISQKVTELRAALDKKQWMATYWLKLKLKTNLFPDFKKLKFTISSRCGI